MGIFGKLKHVADKARGLSKIKGAVQDKVHEKVDEAARRVEKAVKGRTTVTVKNPPLPNDGRAMPRAGKKASPAGTALKIPKQQPEAITPQDPPTKELRITPRNVSKVLDKTLPKAQREKKDQD